MPAYLGALLLAALAILLPSGCGSGEEGETIRLVIPPGTSAAIEAGKQVKAIPDRIEAHVGDTLYVVNRDSSTQFISGLAVSPGQKAEIPLNREGTFVTNCSAHQDRSIKLVVKT